MNKTFYFYTWSSLDENAKGKHSSDKNLKIYLYEKNKRTLLDNQPNFIFQITIICNSLLLTYEGDYYHG